tara:strand:- start:521 stop:1441 length:921 start_codon:yes stop_codon:yes gene_type:complete
MSAVALSAAEQALVTNDKPVLIGSNAVESADYAKWFTGASDNVTSATDLAHADFSTTRAYDRLAHSVTKPASAANTYYLAFDLGSSAPDFDCVMISGHNFGGVGMTLTIEVADNATFGSPSQIATFGTGTYAGTRLVTFDLHHSGSDPMRYTIDTSTPHARYVRIKIVKTSGTMTPEIGEFWLGRRRHLPYKFDQVLDDKRTVSRVADFEARSGVTTRYTYNRGQARRSGTTLIDGAANIATVDSWWSEIEQGTKPFLYCENPSTAPTATQLMHHLGGLDFPQTQPSARQLTLEMRELYPFTATES